MFGFRHVFFAVLFAFITVLSPESVRADTCGATISDIEHIQQTPFILQGYIDKALEMSDEERAQAEKFLSEPGHEEIHLSSLKLYEFKITNAWKGGKIGTRIRLLMEKKREKTLNKGADVLIMSSEQLGDMIWVSPCSLSKSVKESRDNGLIDTLNEVIGIGYDVKVPGSDRLCRTAADCTAVTTHCGECDCGAPISVGAVRKHMKKLAETCSGSEGNTASCEPHQCEPYLPMCIEAQCY